MKKCTLCVDRMYNDNLPEEDRVPACVKSCPASARHFGDLADPTSDVSVMVAERGGIDLMPEQGNRPVNKYLPPRPKSGTQACGAGREEELSLVKMADTPKADGFVGWLDSALSKLG